MAVYGINYDEGNKDLGYKSVRIHYGDDEEKIFDSGNFVKDWFDLIKLIIMELSKTESHFVGSSDVDHFFMDGADELYDYAWLKTDGDKSTLIYECDEELIQFYVPKGTQPTWEELKEMCK
jgi:hypothetical protein